MERGWKVNMMVKWGPVQHRQHYARQSTLSISHPVRWCPHPWIDIFLVYVNLWWLSKMPVDVHTIGLNVDCGRYRLSFRFPRIRKYTGVVCTSCYPLIYGILKMKTKPQWAPSPLVTSMYLSEPLLQPGEVARGSRGSKVLHEVAITLVLILLVEGAHFISLKSWERCKRS